MFDYRSRTDMLELAREVRSIPANQVQLFYAAVLAYDIMRLNWYLRWFVNLLAKLKNMPRATVYLILLGKLQERDPTTYRTAISALSEHIVNGKDRVDPKSAGGLCEHEVKKLVMIMETIGWRSSLQPVAPDFTAADYR